MIRIITAIIMSIAIAAAVWWMPTCSFNILLLIILFLGALEYGRMFFADPVERYVTVVAIIIVAGAMFFSWMTVEFVPVLLVVLLFALSLIFMWRAPTLDDVAGRIGISVLGLIYLGIAFPFWSALRELDYGNSIVLLALVPACLCDTFAYVAGKLIGRHKFAPKVSPNKTWEGFAGALLGSVAGAMLMWWLLLPQIPWYLVLGLALIIWIVSPFGDLVESMFKRSCGVKDSGKIIPGHGGILDRLDALVFTGPAVFIYMKYVVGW